MKITGTYSRKLIIHVKLVSSQIWVRRFLMLCKMVSITFQIDFWNFEILKFWNDLRFWNPKTDRSIDSNLGQLLVRHCTIMYDEIEIKKKDSRGSKLLINREVLSFKLKYKGQVSSLCWCNSIRSKNSERHRYSLADCWGIFLISVIFGAKKVGPDLFSILVWSDWGLILADQFLK